MPGFTLVYQHEGLDEGIKKRAERLVNSSFKIQFISKTEKMMLIFRDGNHYPYQILETENEIIIVEGRMYEVEPETDTTFRANCRKILNLEKIDAELNYFQNLDGEFVVYVIQKAGEKIAVVNDFLGRLPQYFFKEKQFVLSRDLFVMDKITTGLLFDESTLYQFLRIGFPLGKRTLYHDIDRLDYSSAVLIDKENLQIRHTPFYFEEVEGAVKGEEALTQLYHLFAEAVKARMQGGDKSVVSLSGGLDSRLVMGELEKNRFKSDYATFFYDNPIIRNDVKVARDLGKLFNRTAQITDLTEWKPELFDELTTAKGGMNYMGMGFILRFLIQLGHTYDLMLTGDGGDKTLAFLFPESTIKPSKFSKHILKNQAVSSRRTLDSFLLTDVREQDQLILEMLNKIEGSNTNFKYKNYLFFERARHWLFEGEDRNRSYLWSTTPFYQPAFFRMVHSFPEREKKNFRFYRQFTDLVDLKLNSIENANWNIPLSDARTVDRMIYQQKVKNKFNFLKGSPGGQLSSHSEMAVLVAALMHKGYGGQIAVNADRHDLNAASSETLFHLITLLKVSEMTWKNY